MSKIVNLGLGNLVWNTVQFELISLTGNNETKEACTYTKILNSIYGEIDKRESKYVTTQYDPGLGQLIRETNADLFKNPDRFSHEVGNMTQSGTQNSYERDLILKLDARERIYCGGVDLVDNPLGSTILKGMYTSLILMANNNVDENTIKKLNDNYIQRLNLREQLYLLDSISLEKSN